jgi:hypothetical protein
MKTVRIIVLIGAAIALVISLLWSFFTRMPRASRGRARKLLSSAEWLDEKSKDGELVKLTGTVRTREAGERLMSPISNIRCVALRIRAQARRGMDPRATLVEKIDYKAFEIEDAEGRVPIEPTEVFFDVSPLAQSKPDAGGRSNVLADLGHANASTAKSNIEETVVAIGTNVTVAGTLATIDGKHRLVGEIACKLEQRGVQLSNDP